jgi:hypothetical protein
LGCFGVVCVFSAGNFGYYYAVCDHKWYVFTRLFPTGSMVDVFARGNKEECTPYQYMDYLVYNSFINLGSIIIST